MKIRRREKIEPIHVIPEDTISLTYNGKVICKDEIHRKMVLDEIVIFDLEPDEIEGAIDGIGGAFLQTELTAAMNHITIGTGQATATALQPQK